MKLKTSVSLSENVVKRVDRAGHKGESRSQTIERLLKDSLEVSARKPADHRDLAIINQHADELNAQAEDVPGYQGEFESR